MTSDQVKYFLEIAKCLNYSMAAEELCISQSSLSKHIQNLEMELGARLFTRTTRKTTLTQAGIDFMEHAQIMLADYQNMLADMRKHIPQSRKSVALSSIPIMSIYKITEMIAAFNEIYPDITIEIIEEDTIYVIQHLREQKADIALAVTNVLTGSDIRRYPIVDDDMVLIVHKNHRFADRDCIDLKEASDENFIFLGVETAMYNVCYEQCLRAGFEPRVTNTRQTNMQIETIIDFVSNGLGISIMMDQAARYYRNPNYRIIRLKDTTTAHLAFLCRNEHLSQSCRQLLDFSLNYFGQKSDAQAKRMDS